MGIGAKKKTGKHSEGKGGPWKLLTGHFTCFQLRALSPSTTRLHTPIPDTGLLLHGFGLCHLLWETLSRTKVGSFLAFRPGEGGIYKSRLISTPLVQNLTMESE